MAHGTCRELARCLSAFVDGELDASQSMTLQQHVDECEHCASRVGFARASRSSVRNTVKAVQAPEAFRAKMAELVVQAGEANRSDVMTGQRLLSWRFVGPTAAAAAFALVWASVSKMQDRAAEDASKGAPATHTAAAKQASMISVDALLDTMIDQHANPLPPEATNPTEFATFDKFVGVPVRTIPQDGRLNGKLLGARMVPLQEQRAAMFQYVIQNGRRVSVYVYNPKKVRIAASPALRERVVDNAPVYVGYVRGYSVAVTDRRGVGYAMASDLSENESSHLILAVGNQ